MIIIKNLAVALSGLIGLGIGYCGAFAKWPCRSRVRDMLFPKR